MDTQILGPLTPLDLAWLGGALLALAGLIRKIWPVIRKLNHFVDDWFGEDARPGQDARPGVPEQLRMLTDHAARTDRRMDAIEHELKPNSGSSLRDAVDRVEQTVKSGR